MQKGISKAILEAIFLFDSADICRNNIAEDYRGCVASPIAIASYMTEVKNQARMVAGFSDVNWSSQYKQSKTTPTSPN